MTIAETDAIEVARKFASDRGPLLWDEASLSVRLGDIEGRIAWVVEVADTDPSEGEPWMRTVWAPVRYFVDQTTGELFGLATERSLTTFSGDSKSAP